MAGMEVDLEGPYRSISRGSDGSRTGWSPIPIGKGARQGGKEFQEDSFGSFASENNRVIVGGIWDGHGGYNGRVASGQARETALSFFEQFKLECESWSEEEWQVKLKELFALQHEQIRAKFVEETKEHSNQALRRVVDGKGIVRIPSGDPVHGGSTATVLVMIRPTPGSDESPTVICANCGDSTALIVDLTAPTDKDGVNPKHVTEVRRMSRMRSMCD
jgi:serine/threonine protein phosphatase PrpC